MYKILILITACFSLSSTYSYVEPVTIKTAEDLISYTPSKCENTKHNESDPVTKVTSDSCVNLYKGKDCEGWFIRWHSFHPDGIKGKVAHIWDDNQDLYKSNVFVGSIGPCFEPCDARNWDNYNSSESVHVTVYNDLDFKGSQWNDSLNNASCYKIPEYLKPLRSVKILGDNSSCIELHLSSTCSGDYYIILRPGYPMLNNIYHHGFYMFARLSDTNVKGVSRCGAFCTSSVGKTSTIYESERDDLDITVQTKAPLTKSSYFDAVKRTASFNISGCTNLPAYLIGELIKLSSNNDKCINTYTKENCRGRITRWRPYLKPFYDPTHHWDSDEEILEMESFKVKSLDLCKDKCDPAYWEGSSKVKRVKVLLFDEKHFAGNSTTLMVESGSCTVLPRSFTPKSVKIKGNDSCIEMHSAPHCGSRNYVILRPGYPDLNDLFHYGMDNFFSVRSTKAVSLCGDFCDNGNITDVKEPPKENPGKGIVTAFDFVGYYGYPTPYNLSQGCINTENKGKTLKSIRTYQQCVVLYGSEDCRMESPLTETLQTSGKSAEYYVEKFTAFTAPVVIKSLRLCNETELTYLDVKANLKDCHCCGNAESHEFTAMFYWLLTFGLLVYTALVAMISASILSKYQSYSLRVISKRFTVLYNARDKDCAESD